MRVAFVGKGGAGKSAIAGTFARALARNGDDVLAIDSDPMPGLALSIGMASDDAPLPDDIVVERAEGEQGPRYRLRPDLSPVEAVERYAQHGPDGIRFLQYGKLRGHVAATMRSQTAFRQITTRLPADRWSIVGDLPGGTRQPAFGWGDYAETYLLVAEPTVKSMLAARRIARLLAKRGAGNGQEVLVIANRVLDPADADRVSQRLGIEVIAVVPHDDAIVEAERAGKAPIDHAPTSPAVRAVVELADRLRSRS